MELEEKSLSFVSKVKEWCPDYADTTSCFFTLGHLCYRDITTASELNNI